MPAVKAKPMIIISHTVVAACARLPSGTFLAIKVNSEVPQALTPKPIKLKEKTAKPMPAEGELAIHIVDTAARKPPTPSTTMPPIIQGVLRRPLSAP